MLGRGWLVLYIYSISLFYICVWSNLFPLTTFSLAAFDQWYNFLKKIYIPIIPKVIKMFYLIACFARVLSHNEVRQIFLVFFPPDLLLRNFVHMVLFYVRDHLLYIPVTQLYKFKRPWRLKQNDFNMSTCRIVRFCIAGNILLYLQKNGWIL